jgi:hypothetical protein
LVKGTLLTPGRDDNLVADLSAYLDGELPEVRAREIEQQLADSDECRALLAELRDVAETLGQLPRQRAPDELMAALRRQAERRHLFDDARRPRPGGVLRLFLRLSAAAAVIGGCVLVGWHVADRSQTRPLQPTPRDYALVDRLTAEAAAPPELARAEHDGAPALAQKATGAGPLAEQPAEAAEPLPTDAAFAHGTVAADDDGMAVATREPEPIHPAAPVPASSAAPAPAVAARTPADGLPVASAEVEIHVVPLDSAAHAAARRVLAGLGEAALSDEQDRMGVAAGRLGSAGPWCIAPCLRMRSPHSWPTCRPVCRSRLLLRCDPASTQGRYRAARCRLQAPQNLKWPPARSWPQRRSGIRRRRPDAARAPADIAPTETSRLRYQRKRRPRRHGGAAPGTHLS